MSPPKMQVLKHCINLFMGVVVVVLALGVCMWGGSRLDETTIQRAFLAVGEFKLLCVLIFLGEVDWAPKHVCCVFIDRKR